MTDTDTAIRGRKVTLRSKRLGDAEDDYRWRADEELAALDATSPLRATLQEFSRIYQGEIRYPTPWVRRYAIDTYDGNHIGNCMIYDIDGSSGTAELGIMVGERDYWDQGFGVDAMACLMDEALRLPGIKNLYLHTLVWNHRARKAFSKCGFREVREVRRANRDFIRMETSQWEWEAIRSNFLDPPDQAEPE